MLVPVKIPVNPLGTGPSGFLPILGLERNTVALPI